MVGSRSPRPSACVPTVWFSRNEAGRLLGLDNQVQPGAVIYLVGIFRMGFCLSCVVSCGPAIFRMSLRSCPVAYAYLGVSRLGGQRDLEKGEC